MRSLDELLVEPDAWPVLDGWLKAADGAHAITASPERGAETLIALQVTTRSILGSMAMHAAGISVGHGWLRHLGCGGAGIGDGLREWNAEIGGAPLDPPLDRALVVALDVLGGVFAVNGGGLPGSPGEVFYFVPDTQAWMSLGMGHSAFVEWSLSPNLEPFYGDQRWPGWQDEIAVMDADHAMSFYPPLGYETTSLGERSRRPVLARELWHFLHALARQTGGLPEASRVRFDFK